MRVGDAQVGVLDENLQRACLEALELSRGECRAFALKMTWEASARAFLTHVAEGNKVVRMRRLWLRRRRRAAEPTEESPLADEGDARVTCP